MSLQDTTGDLTNKTTETFAAEAEATHEIRARDLGVYPADGAVVEVKLPNTGGRPDGSISIHHIGSDETKSKITVRLGPGQKFKVGEDLNYIHFDNKLYRHPDKVSWLKAIFTGKAWRAFSHARAGENIALQHIENHTDEVLSFTVDHDSYATAVDLAETPGQAFWFKQKAFLGGVSQMDDSKAYKLGFHYNPVASSVIGLMGNLNPFSKKKVHTDSKIHGNVFGNGVILIGSSDKSIFHGVPADGGQETFDAERFVAASHNAHRGVQLNYSPATWWARIFDSEVDMRQMEVHTKRGSEEHGWVLTR